MIMKKTEPKLHKETWRIQRGDNRIVVKISTDDINEEIELTADDLIEE